MSLERFRAHHQAVRYCRVGSPLRHQGEHFDFSRREPVERAWITGSAQQCRDDGRVDHTFTVDHATKGIDDHRDVGRPLLQQVAHVLGSELEAADGEHTGPVPDRYVAPR